MRIKLEVELTASGKMGLIHLGDIKDHKTKKIIGSYSHTFSNLCVGYRGMGVSVSVEDICIAIDKALSQKSIILEDHNE